MTEQTTGMSFSRRNFIKGAAALTATGALVGCAPAKETLAETGEETVEVPETKIYSGACRAQCGQGCYLNVHVRDGRVVRTTAGHFDEAPSSTVSARRASSNPPACTAPSDCITPCVV